MSTQDFSSRAFERTFERTRLALNTINEAESWGNLDRVLFSENLFDVPEILQDAYFISDTMVYYDDLRRRDFPTFQLVLRNATELMRSLSRYVFVSKRFFSGRFFCTYCSALQVAIQHPDLEGFTSLVPEEYAAQSFHGQQQYEQDRLRVYFDMLDDLVERCFKKLEILRIPPAERPAPPPAASNPSVTGAALPDNVDDGATSENHAGSDLGERESDTYLDLNLFPPGYEFDSERGRNGASTSRDPASNDTDHDVEAADQGNIDNEMRLRSMTSVGGYCPICGCSGVEYLRAYSPDAANAEWSDEADSAGSGAILRNFV